jgi:sugar phosphate isomerase/epimerase
VKAIAPVLAVLLAAALLWPLAGCSGGSGPPPTRRALPNPFYVLPFPLESLAPAEQVRLVHELGYDGIAFYGPADRGTIERTRAYRESPLVRSGQVALGASSWTIDADAPQPFDAGQVEELCLTLENTGTLLWLLVHSQKPRSAGNDAAAAAAVGRFADIAGRHGVVVALYPHDGFYMASAEHALRLSRLAGRGDLKLSLHLCHELRAGNGGRIAEVIEATLPDIAIASINGANRAVNPGSPDWSDAIRPLGEGDYDVTGYLRALVGAGYRGPIALHTFGLTGEPRDLLARSRRAWDQMSATVSQVDP